jgi:peptidoglycan hydrolase-like protein with peptidoglycan-binding domain
MNTGKPITAPNTRFVKRVLHIGSRGDDVYYVQDLLDELNGFYKFCPVRRLQPNGYFGPETQKFLKFFQYWVDLEKDACFAYFEKKTSDALEQAYAEYLDDLRVQGTFARTRKMFDDLINNPKPVQKKPDPFDKY